MKSEYYIGGGVGGSHLLTEKEAKVGGRELGHGARLVTSAQ